MVRGDGMAEFCLACFNRINETQDKIIFPLFCAIYFFQKLWYNKRGGASDMQKKRFYIGTVVAIVLSLVLAACGTASPQNPWDDAVYTSDAVLGTGAKAVTVRVIVAENAVDFEIHTDCETLSEALLAHDLIAGEMGAYGLYVKTVNGILADYNVTKSYWALTKDGAYVNSGVDGVSISDGEQYELTYTEAE